MKTAETTKNRIPSVVALLLMLCLVFCSTAIGVQAQEFDGYFPDVEWRTSTPEAQGLSRHVLDDMLSFYLQNEVKIDSLLVVKNGYLVVEEYPSGYASSDLHHLFSCTKGVLSVLIGIAIDRAIIPSDGEPMLQYFADWTERELDSRMRDITIANLLTMTMGIEWSEYYREYESDFDRMTREEDWVSYILSRKMYTNPGHEFVYNSGASHLLSAILQQASGMSSFDFAQTYLFEPLGIDNADWETDPNAIFRGDSRMKLTPRDLAKIGYLLLRGGFWDGRQVVSTDWVKKATAPHVNTTISLPRGESRQLSYGYHWWMDPQLGYYAAIGWGGQSMIIMPDDDLVLVMTAASAHYSVSTDYIAREWLLPALGSDVPEPIDVSGLRSGINLDSIRMLLVYTLATIPIPIALTRIRDNDEEELSIRGQ
ncbi:MAG: class C beta-lactamase-related serine hydrolase [Candidatus Thorarchaeota archaeon]|nr:class C beta-lactamase-related serine hydrolase [Candidatus Thorarchaeota archaeon]